MKAIRKSYPVTFTEINYGGTALRCWLRHNPPDYVSKSGNVHRWRSETAAKRNLLRMYGISGRSAADLHIRPVWARTKMSRLRAYGTHEQMTVLLKTAIKTWNELPGGREIETIFERMFPTRLELEFTPLVDKAAKP